MSINFFDRTYFLCLAFWNIFHLILLTSNVFLWVSFQAYKRIGTSLGGSTSRMWIWFDFSRPMEQSGKWMLLASVYAWMNSPWGNAQFWDFSQDFAIPFLPLIAEKSRTETRCSSYWTPKCAGHVHNNISIFGRIGEDVHPDCLRQLCITIMRKTHYRLLTHLRDFEAASSRVPFGGGGVLVPPWSYPRVPYQSTPSF